MAHKYNQPGFPFVLLDEDGFMKFYTKDGHLVGGNIKLRITDSVDEPNIVVAICACNIVKDKEDMERELVRFREIEDAERR